MKRIIDFQAATGFQQSMAFSRGVLGGISSSLWVTRWTCVATGKAGRPARRAGQSTAVLLARRRQGKTTRGLLLWESAQEVQERLPRTG
jgi:hypothetical protein